MINEDQGLVGDEEDDRGDDQVTTTEEGGQGGQSTNFVAIGGDTTFLVGFSTSGILERPILSFHLATWKSGLASVGSHRLTPTGEEDVEMTMTTGEQAYHDGSPAFLWVSVWMDGTMVE